MSLFGQKVRLLRQQHDVTQSVLATHLGLSSHSHLVKIEAGQRGTSTMLAVKTAHFFNVTVTYLLDDTVPIEQIQIWQGQPLSNRDHPTRQLGPKVRYLREHRQFSQSDLARQLDLAGQATISNIEHGRKTVTPALLLRLASALQATPDYFVRDEVDISAFDAEQSSM